MCRVAYRNMDIWRSYGGDENREDAEWTPQETNDKPLTHEHTRLAH